MKRAVLLSLLLLSASGLGLTGCNDDESTPYFTRLTVTPACGVVPLQVEGLAIATGGNETGPATGGNNNLEMTWDFGDGVNSNTSISYHEYATPGEYNVVVTGKDPDGQVATISQMVIVLPDTMTVEASHDRADSTALRGEPIQFNVLADACSIDPDEDDDYRNLTFKWEMKSPMNHVFYGRSPVFAYGAIGDYYPVCTVTLPSLAVSRSDTLFVRIVNAP